MDKTSYVFCVNNLNHQKDKISIICHGMNPQLTYYSLLNTKLWKLQKMNNNSTFCNHKIFAHVKL